MLRWRITDPAEPITQDWGPGCDPGRVSPAPSDNAFYIQNRFHPKLSELRMSFPDFHLQEVTQNIESSRKEKKNGDAKGCFRTKRKSKLSSKHNLLQTEEQAPRRGGSVGSLRHKELVFPDNPDGLSNIKDSRKPPLPPSLWQEMYCWNIATKVGSQGKFLKELLMDIYSTIMTKYQLKAAL